MTQDQQDGRDQLKRSIISEVSLYYRTWKLPLAFEIINRTHYSRALKVISESLTEFIQADMSEDILFASTLKGKKVLFPMNDTVRQALADDRLIDLLVEYDSSPLTGRRKAVKL